jgi:glutamate-1-semialdehyde 2,1-aminomutase
MGAVTAALPDQGTDHPIDGDETLFDVVFTDRKVRDYRDMTQPSRASGAEFAKALV